MQLSDILGKNMVDMSSAAVDPEIGAALAIIGYCLDNSRFDTITNKLLTRELTEKMPNWRLHARLDIFHWGLEIGYK